MKKEIEFERVVRYEEYDWQKGEIGLSHLFSWILGILTGIMFIGIFQSNDFLFWGSISLLAIVFIITIQKKGIVTYRRIK